MARFLVLHSKTSHRENSLRQLCDRSRAQRAHGPKSVSGNAGLRHRRLARLHRAGGKSQISHEVQSESHQRDRQISGLFAAQVSAFGPCSRTARHQPPSSVPRPGRKTDPGNVRPFCSARFSSPRSSSPASAAPSPSPASASPTATSTTSTTPYRRSFTTTATTRPAGVSRGTRNATAAR